MLLRASLPAVCILLSQLAAGAEQEATAAPQVIPAAAPRIALIIDDLGYSLRNGRRAINLPGAVTCSILPGTPHAHTLAQHARDTGKEIMLHLPMQGAPEKRVEPDSLSPEMTEGDFREILRLQLAAVPGVAGVNNHMGSALTPLPDQMNWLMDELAQRTLYFVDSRTTHLTVSKSAARTHQVPFMERDVFLDNDKDPAAIEKAFHQLVRKARKRGHAVGIAHAHSVTLATLEQLLPKLAEEGIVLEPVSNLLPQKEVPMENLTAQTTPQMPLAGRAATMDGANAEKARSGYLPETAK